MTFNTLLESVNAVLDKISKNKKGHFSSSTKIEKLMGPYKKCTITVYYISLSDKSTTMFLEHSMVDRCTDKDILIERCSIETLTELLLRLNEEKESIV